jgi:hypothetical protein
MTSDMMIGFFRAVSMKWLSLKKMTPERGMISEVTLVDAGGCI